MRKSLPQFLQIADHIDSVLSGKLSTDLVKEHGEKYFSPKNCGCLCPVTVDEEIWDLLPRRARSVDLAFQHVQEALIPGLSSLAMLADKLANNAKNSKTIDIAEILHHVIDSLVLVSQANWSLNMKRREQIKPDIASPYSRLCKPELAPTTKLFGDDLSKQLKDMTDVTRVGKQLQKKTADQRPHYQKPYDRSRLNFNKKHPNRKLFFRVQSCGVSDRSAAQEKPKEPVNTQVNNKHNYIDFGLKLQCQTVTVLAGQVKNHICHWEAVTSDPFILNAIQHYNIEFEETPPLQACPPRNIVFSNSDKNVINDEITKLLKKGVTEHAHYTEIVMCLLCLFVLRRMALTV